MTESAMPPWMEPIWRFLQVWGVPIGMSGAYLVLMWSSDTDNTGKAWMAIGLGFVFVIWFVFRLLTQNAALSRAISIGDATRILEVSNRFLKTHRVAKARAPYLVALAVAHELRSEWALALAALDEAKLSMLSPNERAPWELRAASTRIAALIGSGKLAEARVVLERDLRPDAQHAVHSDAYLAANLAAGRVLAAEGKRTEAAARLARVTEDIRATSAMRAAVASVLA